MLEMYGKYKVPRTLVYLRDLDATLRVEGSSLEKGLGFSLLHGLYRCARTPFDLIPFATLANQSKGVHFGLLTDFGTVSHLEEAYIVGVFPGRSTQPLQLIARNLYEFLNLAVSEKLPLLDEELGGLSAMERQEREWIQHTIRLHLSLLERDAARYPDESVQVTRQKQIVLSTQDGLGITSFSSENERHAQFQWPSTHVPTVEEMAVFCQEVSVESRLALIRDYQFLYAEHPEGCHQQHVDFLVQQMVKLGLVDEAIRCKWHASS